MEKRANVTIVSGEVLIPKEARGDVKVRVLRAFCCGRGGDILSPRAARRRPSSPPRLMSKKRRRHSAGKTVGSNNSMVNAPETSAERPGACKMIVAAVVVVNDGRWWRSARSPKPAPRTSQVRGLGACLDLLQATIHGRRSRLRRSSRPSLMQQRHLQWMSLVNDLCFSFSFFRPSRPSARHRPRLSPDIAPLRTPTAVYNNAAK